MRTPPVVVALAVAFAAAAHAQTAREALEVTRQAAETQRRVLVAGALPMSEAESRDFWPLFDDYEKQRKALDERINHVVADFIAAGAGLGDKQAGALLDEWLKLEEQHARLRRDFAARMGRALPPRKLLRFFQIDNKLDAVVRADLTRQIPLAP
jgi:hypothetical protein